MPRLVPARPPRCVRKRTGFSTSILIAHIQVFIILALARLLFQVPFLGNPLALYVASLLFIAGNLIVGVALSSFARNQLQAMQMTMFYFLPNMMLSGFMFPFAGMPGWAQTIDNLLPHYEIGRASCRERV